MTLPHSPYGPNTSPQMSWLDDTFGAVGAQGVIPCTVTGTNALTLAPFTNALVPNGYTVQGIPITVSFVAANTSAGPITVAVAGLPTVNVYIAGGGGAAGANAIMAGVYYQLVYVPSLASGAGGFVINNVTTSGLAFTPLQFGGTGNGVANDTSAVQNAINFATAFGGETFIGSGLSYYIPGGLTIPSTAVVRGGGTILGDAVVPGNFPTTAISIVGSVGAPITLQTSAIQPGTRSVNVANSVGVGNIVVLCNDSGAVTSRIEILVAALTTTSSTVAFTTPTVANYASSTGSQLRIMTPATASFDGVTLENIEFLAQYCQAITMRGVRTFQTIIQTRTDFQDVFDLIANQGVSIAPALDIIDSSRDTTMKGNYTGGVSASDLGVITVLGAQKYNIDAIVTGATGASGYLHAIDLDVDYSVPPNPTGWLYLPNTEGSVHVIVAGLPTGSTSIQIVNPGAGISDAVTRDIYVSGILGVPGDLSANVGGINMNNVSHITVAADFGGTTGAGYEIGTQSSSVQSDIKFLGYNGPIGTINGTNTLISGLLLPWAPQLFSNGSGGGISYLSRNGAYEIDGDFATVSFNVTLNGLSGVSPGNLTIAGLPVTVSNSSAALGEGGVINYATSMSGLTSTITLTPFANTAQAGLYMTGPTGVAALTNGNLTTGTTIAGSLHYHA